MKKFFTLLVSIAMLLAILTIANASFSDVTTNHINATAIEFVQNEGIVAGYSDSTFRPDTTINRAELTKIIIESNFTKEEIENCNDRNNFSDVQSSDWFANYICLAKNKGIIAGYSDGNFRPATQVNFAEAAKIISGAFGFEIGQDEIWYKPFVEQLDSRKAIPISITSFDKNITRGEMAEMIWRLRTGEEGVGSVGFAEIAEMGGNIEKEIKNLAGAINLFLTEKSKICQGTHCDFMTVILEECRGEIKEIDLLNLQIGILAPPGTLSRKAYFCEENNKFWVNDFISAEPPTWYGPFEIHNQCNLFECESGTLVLFE